MKRSILTPALLAAIILATFGAAPAASPTPSLPASTGLNFRPAPSELTASCDAAIETSKQNFAKILAAPASSATFATLQAIETASADFNDATAVQAGLFELSPDKAVRTASAACSQKVQDYAVEVQSDPRIYAVAQRVAALGSAPTPAGAKLNEYYLIGGKRAGAGLDPEARKQTTALFQRLNKLQLDFAQELSNDKTTITVSRAEAKSLPADFVTTLKKTTSGYAVPVDESTYGQFMLSESSSAARKRFMTAYSKRGGTKNVQRLQEAIGVRDQLAHLLGYASWAAYQLDVKMAKTPQRVEELLNTVSGKLLPKAKSEIASLTTFKNSRGSAGSLQRWDYGYYENLLIKTKYAVDDQKVRSYFPVDHVIASVLGIYQKLLGVTFAQIAPADAWAPGVLEYSITDTASGKPIGWFFLDLYPRDGKFSHFANFPVRPGRLLPDGTFQKPVSAIVGNWPVHATGKPALLDHEEVITFFHEFGHLMHSTLSTAPYETLFGTSVRPDFVEAPSQMLENFMWQPSILKEVSSNYQTGQPLPDALIAKMIALKHVADGYDWSTQAFYAQYDMTIHSSGPHINVDTTWFELQKRMTPFSSIPGTHPEAGFGHLMGGYDAGYYGYLWAKVYAQDIFTRFQAEGLENPQVGAAYRKDILEPGAAVEPDVLVEHFLGRPMNPDAFYRDIGITQ
ncbi:MAG: Zn-dependent oligopeptidase [Candidatus Eremiobacteraeota bacterium]|nr:Zn-dependent oligopeptidase [Candidatus Eremiobacteraeota bacterium]